MAFFDRLNDLAKNLGEKTNDVIETGKLTSKANSERNAAGEELKKIGQYYYGVFAAGGEVAQEVLELCRSAEAHYAAAAEAQGELDRIQGEKEAARAAAQAAQAAAAQPAGTDCPGCGSWNAAGVKFCQNCGTRLEAPASAGLVCQECGTKNEPGTRFCGNCGQRL